MTARYFIAAMVLILAVAVPAGALQPLGPLKDRWEGEVAGILGYQEMALEYTIQDDNLEHTYSIRCSEEQKAILKENLGRHVILRGEILEYVPGIRYIDIQGRKQGLD